MQPSKQNFQIRNGVLVALFAFISILFMPLSNAVAEETNSLRIGGDYKFLTLRVGADFRECRRACKKRCEL